MDVKDHRARPARKAAQGRSTRDALLRVARAEFGARGYAAVSIDEIVGGASVTKGAFYHHFASKEDLFLLVYESVRRELSRTAFVEVFAAGRAGVGALGALGGQTDAEVWRLLLAGCRRYLGLHADPAVSRILLVDAASVLPWETRQRVDREWGTTLLRAALRRSIRRGIVRPLPLGTLARILVGALNEASLLIAHSQDPEADLDAAMTVVEALLDGLRPAPA